jgi:hypothetical protein
MSSFTINVPHNIGLELYDLVKDDFANLSNNMNDYKTGDTVDTVDTVEVSNDERVWKKTIFIALFEGSSKPVLAVDPHYIDAFNNKEGLKQR